MENKENKVCAAELNDEALKDVNGGSGNADYVELYGDGIVASEVGPLADNNCEVPLI